MHSFVFESLNKNLMAHQTCPLNRDFVKYQRVRFDLIWNLFYCWFLCIAFYFPQMCLSSFASHAEFWYSSPKHWSSYKLQIPGRNIICFLKLYMAFSNQQSTEEWFFHSELLHHLSKTSRADLTYIVCSIATNTKTNSSL